MIELQQPPTLPIHDVMPRYSSIEIDAQKKKIRQNFGTGVDSQYLSQLWEQLHKIRGYVSYQL
jgi:hypothetical protein